MIDLLALTFLKRDRPMDEVQIKIVGSQSGKGLVESRLDVFWGVKCVPQLGGFINTANRRAGSDVTLEVIQMSSRGTPLSRMALPTSTSF